MQFSFDKGDWLMGIIATAITTEMLAAAVACGESGASDLDGAVQTLLSSSQRWMELWGPRLIGWINKRVVLIGWINKRVVLIGWINKRVVLPRWLTSQGSDTLHKPGVCQEVTRSRGQGEGLVFSPCFSEDQTSQEPNSMCIYTGLYFAVFLTLIWCLLFLCLVY